MEQQEFSMPRIGENAPEFKATTTQGEINFPQDYSGKWKILFSVVQTCGTCNLFLIKFTSFAMFLEP